MAVKRFLLILFLLSGYYLLNAQEKIEIDLAFAGHSRIISLNSGFDPRFSGASMSLTAGIPIGRFVLKTGLETGISPISNYLASSIGVYRQKVLKNPRFVLETGLNTLHGASLFKPHSLYLFAIGEETSISFTTKKANRISLFLEARYLTCPGYSDYSQNYGFVELNTGIMFCFLTGKE